MSRRPEKLIGRTFRSSMRSVDTQAVEAAQDAPPVELFCLLRRPFLIGKKWSTETEFVADDREGAMFVVTDLTRFGQGNPNVCTALIDLDTGACVRPMPYFAYDLVRKHGVIPGALFSGQFTPKQSLSRPHMEDCDYSGLNYHGPATREQFHAALSGSLSNSISAGFGYQLKAGDKVIPVGCGGDKSIITIGVHSQNIEIRPDSFNNAKIKVCFSDASGAHFNYIPITDLGFFDYASQHRDAGTLATLNAHLNSSDEVLLRIGLSRVHAQGERNGYWLQVNGIYTFPSKLDFVRGYCA